MLMKAIPFSYLSRELAPIPPRAGRPSQSCSRALTHKLHIGAEAQSNLAQLHQVSIIQLMRLLLDLVDDDAVVATQIRDHEAPIVCVEVQHRVPSRDGIIMQADVIVAVTAYADVGGLQRIARRIAVEHVEPAIDGARLLHRESLGLRLRG